MSLDEHSFDKHSDFKANGTKKKESNSDISSCGIKGQKFAGQNIQKEVMSAPK